jgi:hypothetical protein
MLFQVPFLTKLSPVYTGYFRGASRRAASSRPFREVP